MRYSSFGISSWKTKLYAIKASKAINSTVKIKVFNIKNELDVKFKNKKIIDTYIDKDKLIHYY